MRATILLPGLLALCFKVFDNLNLAVYAVFGTLASLVLSSFGGTRRDKAIAHAGLAVAGSVTLVLGTLASGSTLVAALVALPVAFAVYFSGIAGPNAASGVTAALLVFVLPVAANAGPSAIPDRLAGWWLASGLAALAVLAARPRSAGDRLRSSAAACASAIAEYLGRALEGSADAALRRETLAAKQAMQGVFASTPYRPVGLAAPDQGLANAVHLLEWCAALVCDAATGHLDLHAAAPEDRALVAGAIVQLHCAEQLLRGEPAEPQFEEVWHARARSISRLRSLGGTPEEVLHESSHAYHAQVISLAASVAAAEAMLAAGRASADDIRELRGEWMAGDGHPQTAERVPRPRWRRVAALGAAIAPDATLRSLWFRNSARGAVALAAAVAIARASDVQHGFWVVLGTLSVLRTSATATGATALRAIVGTAAGFVVGGALVAAIGTSTSALWIAFPVATLVASYAPGTAPFAVGQAAFTVNIVVLFNLLDPAGWRVGLVRVEDVAIGCAVSIVVGALFWPRGASAIVGDDLADALRSGATYLAESTAAVLALGRRHVGGAARAAALAGTRLDDALRGYLTEQGSKRLAKEDLWTLAGGALRLRLTAYSLASLPPGGDAEGTHPAALTVRATLGYLADELARFYERVAEQVGRPHRGDQSVAPLELGLDLRGQSELVAPHLEADVPIHYHAETLWVRDHLEQLAGHVAAFGEAAARLAEIRRRPWWR